MNNSFVDVTFKVFLKNRHSLNGEGKIILDNAVLEIKKDLQIYSKSITTTLSSDAIEIAAKKVLATLAPTFEMLAEVCQRRVAPLGATVELS